MMGGRKGRVLEMASSCLVAEGKIAILHFN